MNPLSSEPSSHDENGSSNIDDAVPSSPKASSLPSSPSSKSIPIIHNANASSPKASSTQSTDLKSSKSIPVIYNASINVRNDFILPIPVTSDAILNYSFSTKPGDIAFGMIFKTSSGNEVVLRKKERLETHIAAAIGSIHCPDEDGVLYLQWDNSYSWFTAKELAYKVELVRSCTLEGMTELRNRLSGLQLELSAVNESLLKTTDSLTALTTENVSLNEIITESNKQVTVLNEKVKIEEAEKLGLENKLAECTALLDSKTKSLDESQQLLQTASRKMEEEIKKVVTEELNKREKLEVENKRLCSEILASKKFFNEMEEFHKEREKNLEEQVTDIKEQMAEMSKVIESDMSTKKYRELLKGSYDDSVNDMKALFQAEKEVLVGKVEGLHLEIEVFMEEIDALKSDKVKHNNEIQEKVEIIEKLTSDCNKWVTSLKDLKTIFNSEKESLEAEVKTLRAENTKMSADIKNLDVANEKLRAEQIIWINSRESILNSVSDKDTEFEKLKSQYHNAIENCNVLQAQYESTDKEYSDLKISYQKASNEIKELNISLLQAKATLEDQNKKFEKQVEVSVAKSKQAKQEYETLLNKYTNAVEQHDSFVKSVEMAHKLVHTENSAPNAALEAEKIKTQDAETKLKGLQIEFTTMFKNFEDLKLIRLSEKEVIDQQQSEIEKLQRINALYLEKLKHLNDHNKVEVVTTVDHHNEVENVDHHNEVEAVNHNEVETVDHHEEEKDDSRLIIEVETMKTIENDVPKSKDDCSSEISFASVTSSVAVNKTNLTPSKDMTSEWSLAGFFTRL